MRIDPFAPDALEDPYELYGVLRDGEPVHRIPESDLWMISRYADLVEAAAKPDVFSSHISAVIYAGQGPTPAVLQADPDAIGAVDVLATADPPDHSQQRKLMNRTFRHERIAELEKLVRAFIEPALDRALADGTVDWMEAASVPLPIIVIADVLGMPTTDLEDLRRWGDAGVDLLSGVATIERMMECWQEMTGFLAYLKERLENPAEGSVTAEIANAVQAGGFNEREGVSLLLQLVIAGSESTASLIGSATLMLADDQGLQKELRAAPERIPTFIEEALRLESPFRGHFRITTKETTIGGVTLPEGSRVMLMWGSANRDPSAFPDAARLDLERDHPKAHVGFGSGIHFCLGAPLARMETRVVLERLLARTSVFRLAEEGTRPRHVPSLFVRRLAELPLTLEA
ncbi:MAG TPA: cytochrome P450 [Actinomycetota bacterium]|nr:cytochrome P450 [Actinomycetota bacterium]